MKISVVIPVYNGEKTLANLNEKILEFFQKSSYDFEIIYVHDCGQDKSLEELERLEKAHPKKVKLIKLNRNFGQHNALICGFTFCTGDLIVTLDEDLQHDPYDIIKLIKQQKKGNYDVVYGVYDFLKHSNFRNISSKILKKILAISIPELHKDYSAFRIIRREVAQEITKMQNSYTFLDGYLTWVTQNVSSVKVNHYERFSGESSYTFRSLLKHSLNIIFTFSNLPIRILSVSSIIIFMITLFYSVYVVVRKFIYDDFLSGYPTFIICLGLGISTILLGLGILGEYIYRISLKTTNRPNYIIKK